MEQAKEKHKVLGTRCFNALAVPLAKFEADYVALKAKNPQDPNLPRAQECMEEAKKMKGLAERVMAGAADQIEFAAVQALVKKMDDSARILAMIAKQK